MSDPQYEGAPTEDPMPAPEEAPPAGNVRDGLIHEALGNIAAGFDAVANAVPGAMSLARISTRLRQLADEIVPPPAPAPEPAPEPEPAPVDPPASEDPPPPPPADPETEAGMSGPA